MKNTLIIILVLICSPHVSMAQINFVNAHSVVDFGTVQRGDSAVRQFEFTNAGAGDVRIKSIKSDNPNLKFQWPDKEVQPGRKDVITAICKPVEGGEAGSFNSAVKVESAGSSSKLVVLRVRGTVMPSKADAIPKSFDTSTSIKIPLSRRNRKPVKN